MGLECMGGVGMYMIDFNDWQKQIPATTSVDALIISLSNTLPLYSIV